MTDEQNQGLTRREMLRRGVVTGGAALAWASPVVTTIGLDRALAGVISPSECIPAISWIAIRFTCGTDLTVYYSKFDGSWDSGPPDEHPGCPGFSTENGVDAGDRGFVASLTTGNVTVAAGCVVKQYAVFGGNICNISDTVTLQGTFNVGCPSD